MNVTKGGIFSRTLVVLCFSSILASGKTYRTQPLIFALRNYYGQSAATAYNRLASAKTERRVESRKQEKEDEEEYEYEDEEYDDYQPPRIVFKPLIVVLLEGLMAAGRTLRPATRYESSEYEEVDEDEVKKGAGETSSSSMFRDALSLPFSLLREYGMSALSSYFPGIEQLKNYGQFYENLARTTNAADVAELKEEVESMRKDAPSRSTYETFSMYFPYAIIALKLGSYFVPGLGQVKTALVGLEIIRISWKTASMYNNGDSFYDIFKGLGKEFIQAAIASKIKLNSFDVYCAGSKSRTRTTYKSVNDAFVDLSSMELDTFLTLVNESSYPPLKDKDETMLQTDVTDVVNSYFGDEDLTAEQKTQIIATLEKAVKFIALHAIIPALAKN